MVTALKGPGHRTRVDSGSFAREDLGSKRSFCYASHANSPYDAITASSRPIIGARVSEGILDCENHQVSECGGDGRRLSQLAQKKRPESRIPALRITK
jgi:hypothetical protein